MYAYSLLLRTVHSTSSALPAAVPLLFCHFVVAVLPAGHVAEECEHGMVACAGTASNISVEMIGANAAGLGFVDGVPAAGIHHVSGGVRSSGFLPRKSWLYPASVSRKRLSVRSIGAFSFSVHVGVPFLRLQWNSRPWYSVSAWIARRFARFFFDFFDFFVFLGLFSSSARCFLFGALVDRWLVRASENREFFFVFL